MRKDLKVHKDQQGRKVKRVIRVIPAHRDQQDRRARKDPRERKASRVRRAMPGLKVRRAQLDQPVPWGRNSTLRRSR